MDKSYNPHAIEQRWYQTWEENGYFAPATNKGDRVGFRTLEDGRKVRFFKSTNEVVDL